MVNIRLVLFHFVSQRIFSYLLLFLRIKHSISFHTSLFVSETEECKPTAEMRALALLSYRNLLKLVQEHQIQK